MKCLLTLIFLMITSYSSNSQSISPKDSLEIRSIIEDWNIAWEIKDYALAAKWYSGDAYFVNAFGDKLNGQKEIETLLKEIFALPFVMAGKIVMAGKRETSKHEFQVLSDDNVIVHTAVIRKVQQMPDGSVLPDRKTTHLRGISDARDKQYTKH